MSRTYHSEAMLEALHGHTQPWKWAAPGRQERNSLKGEGMADRLRFHNPGFAIQKGIRDTKESHEYEYGREEREAGGK